MLGGASSRRSAASQLARATGCAAVYDDLRGGWVVAHDRYLRTTVAGISVAGDACGLRTPRAAALQGRLAAISLARSLTGRAHTSAERRTRASLGRGGVLGNGSVLGCGSLGGGSVLSRDSLGNHSVLGRGSLGRGALATITHGWLQSARHRRADSVPGETVVCRCEGITLAQLDARLEGVPGIRNLRDVKLATRAGMGECQGTFCEPLLRELCAGRVPGHSTLAGVDPGGLTPRIPVRPLPIGDGRAGTAAARASTIRDITPPTHR
ncbi:MAG: FAD-dependent oxidoreductase [Subtercola sp.]|nr:FAD-dependent oxidoreductase [Subtercola sp.]